MLVGWGLPAHQDAQSETGGAAARTKPSSSSEAEPLPPPHPHALVVSPSTRAGEASAGAQLRAAPQGAQPTAPMGTSAPPAALTGIISAAASQKMHFFYCIFKSKHNKSAFFFFFLSSAWLGVLSPLGAGRLRSPAAPLMRLPNSPRRSEEASQRNSLEQKPHSTKTTPQENGQDTSASPHRNPPCKNKPFGFTTPSPHSCRYLPARRKRRKNQSGEWDADV